jgi:hypothetical protein
MVWPRVMVGDRAAATRRRPHAEKAEARHVWLEKRALQSAAELACATRGFHPVDELAPRSFMGAGARRLAVMGAPTSDVPTGRRRLVGRRRRRVPFWHALLDRNDESDRRVRPHCVGGHRRHRTRWADRARRRDQRAVSTIEKRCAAVTLTRPKRDRHEPASLGGRSRHECGSGASGVALATSREQDDAESNAYRCDYFPASGTGGFSVSVTVVGRAQAYANSLQTDTITGAAEHVAPLTGVGDKALSAQDGVRAVFGDRMIYVAGVATDQTAVAIIKALQAKLG